MAGEAFGLDPATFDIDAWINGVERPEVTVLLYPYDVDYQAKVAAIEQAMAAAEKVDPSNRGLDEASAEQLRLQLAELRAHRESSALPVRVRQLLDTEIAAVRRKAEAAGTKDAVGVNHWVVAEACVEPKFTPDQLGRLRARDRSGEHMVAQLTAAVVELTRGLPVPFSPAPSGATLTSSPNSEPPEAGE